MVRNKYPEKTIEKILEVSQKLFFEKGYDHTTMQDIVNQGLSKGVIYYHFKSKKEIFEKIMSNIDTTAQDFTQVMNDDSLSGLAKIQKLLELTLKNERKIELMCSAKSLFTEPKIFGEIYLMNMKYQVPNIEILVNIGIEDGSIQSDFPNELSELIVEFFSIWLGLQVYFIEADKFQKKLSFYQKVFASQGMALLDDQLLNELQYFYQKIKSR
ncbi:TetR/AcrR family transcriptional regulator [Isobaculum melis]|uniref:DNA-binding transcriptional regulator, AcrR family n=1 Tax=Isobaculum melis TaxID=142588 RepID=A0A1H9TSY5_9LACT|nr:TetR/AcrR family transcriptional regulator [Isobaculum melis]SES00168.1 DNA-binding transcriptional regulator, AcrR family [Isobaculum melis]